MSSLSEDRNKTMLAEQPSNWKSSQERLKTEFVDKDEKIISQIMDLVQALKPSSHALLTSKLTSGTSTH